MNHPPNGLYDVVRADDGLRQRAEAEYREMPGLKLTVGQASRLWAVGVAETARLLELLVDAGLLYRSKDGAYLLLWNRAGGGQSP